MRFSSPNWRKSIVNNRWTQAVEGFIKRGYYAFNLQVYAAKRGAAVSEVKPSKRLWQALDVAFFKQERTA